MATLDSPGGNAATLRAARVAGQPPSGPTQRALPPLPTPLTETSGPPDDWPLGRAGGRAGDCPMKCLYFSSMIPSYYRCHVDFLLMTSNLVFDIFLFFFFCIFYFFLKLIIVFVKISLIFIDIFYHIANIKFILIVNSAVSLELEIGLLIVHFHSIRN